MTRKRGTRDAHHSLSYGSNEGDKFCIRWDMTISMILTLEEAPFQAQGLEQ